MKKTLLSIAALLFSSLTFAQVATGTLQAERTAAATSAVASRKAAPKKALEANQRYVGAYSSDALATNGLGIPNYSYDKTKAVIALNSDFLAPYVGMKVVGMRYGIMADDVVSQVLVGEFDAQGKFVDAVTTKDVTTSKTGWNTEMFATPYVIKANTDIYAGFEFNQKNTKGTSGNYTTDCYPLSVVKEGLDGQYLYMYAKADQGLNWYSFGNTNGNLSVQLIVEGDVQGYYLSPVSVGSFQTVVNKEKNVNMVFQSAGKEAVKNFSYTYTQNGVTSDEKTMTLDTPESGTIVTLPVTVVGAAQTGSFDFTLNVTKVNGEANLTQFPTATGKNEVKAKDLKPFVVMEEYTGTSCGFCPRGMVGMKKLAEKYSDQFAGIAIHQYSSSDPMYTINYANLSWSGAPSCKLNRGSIIDPYYGSNADICDDVEALLQNIPDAALTVKAEWDAEDDTKLNATATVEGQAAKTYQLAFALTGDNVKGEGTSWMQTNYWNPRYGAFAYDDIEDDLKFLYDEPASYAPAFNDVLISSSYVRTLNKCENVDVPAEGTVEGSYQIPMPVTNTKLMPAIDREKLYVVAFVIDPTTKTIVNGAKAKVATWTSSIKNINGNGTQATEVARYTVDGRQVAAPVKGINIVKMSDGTTQKVIVK